ncbi:DeoR family transcriptional regulator, partial [Salmonella enterica subsp. enterica serovar Infantis]|nr:DeoR family transcriptional regulator [Salmonella enterica subsp. enterica serovar Infantis]
MYLVEERRKLILEEIISAGTVYVSDLAKKYEVTYETIRKDLTHLEKKGLL